MKEIIINKMDNGKRIMLLENGVLIEKYEEIKDKKKIEGNIYVGKVQNVLPGLQAAFVDIGEKKNTFIHLKDILPKIDETKEDVNKFLEGKNIKELVKVGMPITVQVKRDATSNKGARVSTHISLTSRYFVFMPNVEFITVSQKILDSDERNRIINIVKNKLPKESGVIIRTLAKGKTEEELETDLNNVINLWKKISEQFNNKTNKPELLYEDHGILQRLIIDIMDKDINRIIVDDKNIQKEVEKLIEGLGYNIKVELAKNSLEYYDLEKQIDKSQNRKIWLKCGGFITKDKTEALTAIDVNSGKYIGNKNLEETVYTVNKEASIEIAKQLKLRDIGGIVIIDYIDMKKEENKKQIIEILQENLKKDRSKTQVVGFSKLNLLEMTRKHMYSVHNEM